MILIQPGQLFSFNYSTYDQNASLNVAFNIYNTTTGTAIFVQKTPATLAAFGSYMASYTGASSQTYLIIGVVYTDNTYTTVDSSRSPSAEVYQAVEAQTVNFGFAYPTYDQAQTLHLRASVYNMITGTPAFLAHASMVHVAFGVYYGSYTGIAGTTYQIASIVYTDGTFGTPDLTRSPQVDEEEALSVIPQISVAGTGQLIGQTSFGYGFPVFNNSVIPIVRITQGDNAVFFLTAVDANENPVDLTDATFVTTINGPNGVGPVTFGNSQHVANPDQADFPGAFTLTLSQLDTASLGLGPHKEVLTAITLRGNTVTFRGPNLLAVYSDVPYDTFIE